MKIHNRYFIVREAHLALSEATSNIIKRFGLTYAELNGILLEEAQGWNKYAVRLERHPNDPEKKGDEE
jgi:hypothetical protein